MPNEGADLRLTFEDNSYEIDPASSPSMDVTSRRRALLILIGGDPRAHVFHDNRGHPSAGYTLRSSAGGAVQVEADPDMWLDIYSRALGMHVYRALHTRLLDIPIPPGSRSLTVSLSHFDGANNIPVPMADDTRYRIEATLFWNAGDWRVTSQRADSFTIAWDSPPGGAEPVNEFETLGS